MTSRAIATIGMWIAILSFMAYALSTMTYTVLQPYTEATANSPLAQRPPPFDTPATYTAWRSTTEWMPVSYQIIIGIVVVVLALGAIWSTHAIWRNAGEQPIKPAKQEKTARRQQEKLKRERGERISEMLATLDNEELSALEEFYLRDVDDAHYVMNER